MAWEHLGSYSISIARPAVAQAWKAIPWRYSKLAMLVIEMYILSDQVSDGYLDVLYCHAAILLKILPGRCEEEVEMTSCEGNPGFPLEWDIANLLV